MAKQLPLLDVGPETSEKACKPLTPRQQGKEIREAVGLYLFRARRALGISQKEMADQLHLHRQSVTKLERGERSLALEELPLIAAYYKIPMEKILTVLDAPHGYRRGVL